MPSGRAVLPAERRAQRSWSESSSAISITTRSNPRARRIPSQQVCSTVSTSSSLVSEADSSKSSSSASRLLRASSARCAPSTAAAAASATATAIAISLGPGPQPRGRLVDRHEADQLAVRADRDDELVVLLPPVGVVGPVVARDDRARSAELGLVDGAGGDEVGAADVEGGIEQPLDRGPGHGLAPEGADDLRRVRGWRRSRSRPRPAAAG